MKFNFERNLEQEKDGGFVKYWTEDLTQNITASLVYSEIDTEMEIRVSNFQDRFTVVGHRSIMDRMSYDDFVRKVIMHIERHETFKEIKN